MIGMKMKMKVLDPEKGTIRLRPTAGSIALAYAPWLIMAAWAYIGMNASDKVDEPTFDYTSDESLDLAKK